MKIIGISILCFLYSTTLLAQEIEPTVSKDTINLIGVLFTSTGSPAANVLVRSQGTLKGGKTGAIAVTDENGQFALNGIMPNDMLTITGVRYSNLHYYNKGSRLMVIFLPAETTNDIAAENPIEVKAKRITPKTTPSADASSLKNRPAYYLAEPEFPGGSKRFLDYINNRIAYPDKAVKNNIEGTVEVSFIVGKDGHLNNFIILKGIGYDCDSELVKIIQQSPAWKPAIMNGAPATATVSVSVKFTLTDD